MGNAVTSKSTTEITLLSRSINIIQDAQRSPRCIRTHQVLLFILPNCDVRQQLYSEIHTPHAKSREGFGGSTVI